MSTEHAPAPVTDPSQKAAADAAGAIDFVDPVSSIDFLDPASFERGVPHAAYAKLRAEDPVSWHAASYPSPSEPGYWLLTRHADVHQALVDSSGFSSWLGTTSMLNEPVERLDISRLLLINMDPPGHTRYRRLISRSFSSRVIERLEPEVRRLCKNVLDTAVPRGACDFVADIASPLPMRVIFALLGVPEEDWQSLVGMSDQMIDNAGTDAAFAGALSMYAYSDQLASRRREQPGDDVVSQLLTAEVNGDKLTQAEFNAFFLLLVVAGNETTRNLISGGMLALMQNPEQYERLRREPRLMPAAVEEMLRYVSPVVQFRRTAARDLVLGGKTLRAGDRVILAHASANRDERVFADPDRFDIARSPNPHVAFGVGAHLCLGAALARLEARCMFEELFARITDIELTGPVTRLRSNFLNGLKTMPVRFRAIGG